MGMGVDCVGVDREGHVPHLLPQILCHSARREAGKRERKGEKTGKEQRGKGGARRGRRLRIKGTCPPQSSAGSLCPWTVLSLTFQSLAQCLPYNGHQQLVFIFLIVISLFFLYF